VLFLPVSGPGGAGEFHRALAIAGGIARGWPAAAIRFVVSRDASYAANVPFPTLLTERSPTFATAEVGQILRDFRPHVAIFDSSGRVAQYRTAHRLGAKVVFVSSRDSSRRRGFRLRRMRWFDQHWIARPRFLGGDLTAGERVKLRLLGGPETLFLEVLHEPADVVAAGAAQARFGVRPGSYALVCPGGGGVFGHRPDAVPIFYEASCEIAHRACVPVIAVLGSRFSSAAPVPEHVHVTTTLPNGELMGLLQDARLAVLNGGSLLLQAIAQRTPTVAAPIADDQPERIASCVEAGLIRGAVLETQSIATAAAELAADEQALTQMRARAAALDLRNGVDIAVRAIAGWLPAPASCAASAAQRSAASPREDRQRAGTLRIMHVILSSGFAGSERAAAETCNAMSREHHVAIVLRRDHRPLSGGSIRDYLDPAVEVIEVPRALLTRSRLGRALASWQPDIVHTHLRRGTRLVAQLGPEAARIATLHLSINGPHFLETDGLHCISDWQVATVPADYRGRVFLIPNSLVPQPRLSPRRLEELRAELGAGREDFLIGGAGRLAASKGFDVLLKAFARANLPGARLVIVGDGKERAHLERLAGDHAALTGFRTDVKDCYQAFDLFVSSSRREPFGRVIIEALDGGAPVIATDTKGPRDIARRYPVELVPNGDVAALAAALTRAQARARERVHVDLSDFHIDRVAARMLEAYREIISVRARTAASST
jgi:glycosyltransferase involved in cell wall biosynthesis